MIGSVINKMQQGLCPSTPMTNGGGSGGGSGTPYYSNMDQLYGQQSRAAGFMLDQSMPYIPQYMQNTSQMVGEAMDGTLANRMREQAGNDAQAATGAAFGAVDRGMARAGAGFSTNRLLSEANRSAIMGAANKVGAMNQATMNAEDAKWNRNAGAFGQVTGMGNGAMQSLGSAAAGYGSAGGAAMANDAKNAAGYGSFGAAMGSALFKADGGYIDDVHLATGGDAWSAWKNQNPVQSNMPSAHQASPVGAAVTGLAPYAASSGLKAAWNSDAAAPARSAVNTAVQGAKTGIDNAIGSAFSSTQGDLAAKGLLSAGSEQAGLLAAQDAAFLGEGAAAAGNLTAGTSAALGAEAAGTGAGLLTGAAAAVPWIGAAYGVGKLLDLWADGGPVPHDGDPRFANRKDMRPGGPVHGPGTETSDSIPAHLSKGEYVLNAEAVKLIGKKKLDSWNKKGLKLRGAKEEADESTPNVVDSPAEERKESRGLKLAKGGAARKGC